MVEIQPASSRVTWWLATSISISLHRLPIGNCDPLSRFGPIRRWNLREWSYVRVLGRGARLPSIQLQPDILIHRSQQGLGHDGFEDLSDLVAHDRDRPRVGAVPEVHRVIKVEQDLVRVLQPNLERKPQRAAGWTDRCGRRGRHDGVAGCRRGSIKGWSFG